MSEISQQLATPHEYTHKGKTYKVQLIDQKVKAAFEKRLYRKAVEAAQTLKDILTKEEYEDDLRSIRNDYLAGRYTFESEVGRAALSSVSGFSFLVSLLFGIQDEKEIMDLMANGDAELRNLIDTIVKESFPEVVEGAEQKKTQS